MFFIVLHYHEHCLHPLYSLLQSSSLFMLLSQFGIWFCFYGAKIKMTYKGTREQWRHKDHDIYKYVSEKIKPKQCQHKLMTMANHLYGVSVIFYTSV